jgi:hypothetical protein
VHEDLDLYVQDDLELDVLALRGPELLASADGCVDRERPWDDVGDEPLERAPAWLAVLWRQAKEARIAIALRNRRSNLR